MIPDNGGADISGYKIYRATTPTGFSTAPIATTSTPKNAFVDDTSGTAQAKWYYKITGINSRGDGLFSNVVELPITTPTVLESSCTLPGITLGQDPAGDSTGGVAATDILKISAAELPGTPNQIALVMNVADLSTLPPNILYAVRFHAPTPPANGDLDYFVAMASEPAGPRYVYGTVMLVDATATSAAVYTVAGDIDAASAYDAATGNITLIADKALFGNVKTGESLAAVTGTTRPYANLNSPITAGSQDTADAGSYSLVGTAICVANTAPLALLNASPQSGVAPLVVTFTVTGTDADNDLLKTFSLDFGDGAAMNDQNFSSQSMTLTHTYTRLGSLPARLKVTDARGLVSSNLAEKVIVVSDKAGNVPGVPTIGGAAGAASSGSQSQGRFGGGAFGLGLLLPLLTLALRRRRPRVASNR